MSKPDFTADFIKRMNAHALDFGMTLFPIFFIILLTWPLENRYVIRVISSLLIFYGLAILYPALNKGQTIGKKAMKLQPLSYPGDQPLSFWQIHIRELSKYVIFFLTYSLSHIISGYMMENRKDRRVLHDLLLKTYVIDLEKEKKLHEVDSYSQSLGC